jgi:hypothetical protein
MANDFTASVIPILRAKLDTVFQSKATVNPELTNSPVTAVTVLQKQTARTKRRRGRSLHGRKGLV